LDRSKFSYSFENCADIVSSLANKSGQADTTCRTAPQGVAGRLRLKLAASAFRDAGRM
jgi:hypothetical protein